MQPIIDLADPDTQDLLTDALDRTPPIVVTVTARQALCVIAQVQLAGRHPQNTGPGRQVAERAIAGLGRALALASQSDVVDQIITAGWDPRQDLPRDEPTPTRPADESLHGDTEVTYCDDCGAPGATLVSLLLCPECSPLASEDGPSVRACRVCGCTAADCSDCVERTGQPCCLVEQDLCSACRDRAARAAAVEAPPAREGR